jgi:tetratricopeptide (TPR) repeat protein
MSSSLRTGRRGARRTARFLGATVLLGLVTLDRSARASEPVAPPDLEPVSSLPASTLGGEADEPQRGPDPAEAGSTPSSAETLYEQAKARRAHGDLEGAKALLERCYELSRRPELLFNLGQLEREQGHCTSALAHYRDYVTRLPEGPRIEMARTAILELGQECPSASSTEPLLRVAADPSTRQAVPIPASTTSVPDPAASKPLPPDSSGSTGGRARRVLGWCGIGGAALAAGTAVYFAFDAADARREVNALLADANSGRLDRPWDERGAPLERQEERSTRLAIGFAVLGGILGAAGTTFLLWNSPQSQEHRPDVAVALSPGAASAQLISSF